MQSHLRLVAALAVAASATGCAINRTIQLPTSAPPAILSKIVIEDARPPQDREPFAVSSWDACARVYGDKFIEPTKVEYLRAVLAERLAERIADSGPFVVRIERFDTMERCDRTLRREWVAGMNRQGALGGLIGSGVRVPDEGDDFTLQLVGTANGVPFRYRAVADFRDVKRFPYDSPAFRPRIAKLFSGFADLVVKADPQWNTPELDIVDVRAQIRARLAAKGGRSAAAQESGP